MNIVYRKSKQEQKLTNQSMRNILLAKELPFLVCLVIFFMFIIYLGRLTFS